MRSLKPLIVFLFLLALIIPYEIKICSGEYTSYWSFRSDNGFELSITEISRNHQYIICKANSSSSHKLYCLKVSDGSVAWVFQGSHPIGFPFISLTGHQVVFQSDQVYCVNGYSGVIKWSKNSIHAVTVSRNGAIIALYNSSVIELYDSMGINLLNWTINPVLGEISVTALSDSADLLAVGTTQDKLLLFSVESNRILWEGNTRGRPHELSISIHSEYVLVTEQDEFTNPTYLDVFSRESNSCLHTYSYTSRIEAVSVDQEEHFVVGTKYQSFVYSFSIGGLQHNREGTITSPNALSADGLMVVGKTSSSFWTIELSPLLFSLYPVEGANPIYASVSGDARYFVTTMDTHKNYSVLNLFGPTPHRPEPWTLVHLVAITLGLGTLAVLGIIFLKKKWNMRQR